MRKTKRLGTMKLLELTKELSEKKTQELFSYISALEQSEDNCYRKIHEFARAFELIEEEKWI